MGVNQFYRKIGPEDAGLYLGKNLCVRVFVFLRLVITPHCTSHTLIYEINMLMEKWDQLINDHKKSTFVCQVLVTILSTIYNLHTPVIT